MNLNDKLKQERTGLTASQYSDLQELFVDRYVDGMTTKDLVEYVYNDMMQYVENQPEQEFWMIVRTTGMMLMMRLFKRSRS